MSTEFQIFISSTVDDLKPVRKKLLCALEQPGRIVRCSEDPRFPVEPGMTSHDACLAVVRRCHAFFLLIGTRFGAAAAVAFDMTVSFIDMLMVEVK